MNQTKQRQSALQDQALGLWLQNRKSEWAALENRLKRRRPPAGLALEEARAFLAGYRALLSDVSLARRVYGDAPISRYLENLFLQCHEQISRPACHYLSRLADLYHLESPALLRQLKASLLSALVLFLLSLLTGWLLVAAFPELISLFASAKMIEQVQSGHLWTEGLLNIMPSALLSVNIAANNISVALTAFALGGFYGIGTLYIISLNGLMLGATFAYTAAYRLDGQLFNFIIAHGVVELSVIIIAGAMGLQLGEALIRPGGRNRLQAFQQTCADAGKILLAATPFLLCAGLIEGYVSPNPDYGLPERVCIGLCSGFIFWSILLYGLPWRKQPVGGLNAP